MPGKERLSEIWFELYLWRREKFSWFYDWKMARRHKKDMIAEFGYVPGVGDVVEDCRGETHRIVSVDPRDHDSVTLDDGFGASLHACCSNPQPEQRDYYV